mgnify:CR=1 FL=1
MAFRQLLLSLIIATSPAILMAQTVWPTQPIRVIIPYAPGGDADVTLRTLVNKVSQSIQQSIVIEYQPGASGTIGVRTLANTKPNGNTLLFSLDSVYTMMPLLEPNLDFGLQNIKPIMLITSNNLVLVCNPATEINSWDKFISQAKTRSMTIATGGASSVTSIVLRDIIAKIQTKHSIVPILAVPFNGTNPAMMATLTGTTECTLLSVGPAVQLINANKLNAVVVTGATRTPSLPNTPTLDEMRIPNVFGTVYQLLSITAGTDDDIIRKIKNAFHDALGDVAIVEALKKIEQYPVDDNSNVEQQLKSIAAARATVLKGSLSK